MNKVNAILNSSKYREYLKRNEEYEGDRVFCKHDIGHFLDVARIAYIMFLEKHIEIDKQIVYAAALLHDIGRWMQYKDGTPHEVASYRLAEEILVECGFIEEDRKVVLGAILKHRGGLEEKETFDEIFYLSDKLSRTCFSCAATKECKWSEEKKNYKITY